jgi:hypothetical protein
MATANSIYMSDEYQEIEVIGWGRRLTSSCVGAILGIILLFASFFILYWNEGRVDVSQIAKTAVEISASSPSTGQGKLVSTTGTITSSQLLGDDLFLQPGKYIIVSRTVEIFAWKQNKESTTEKNVGGSATKTTTYTYTKEWTSNPEDSSSFRYPEGHRNPAKSVTSLDYIVSDAKVGIYSLDTGSLDYRNNHKVNRGGGITLSEGIGRPKFDILPLNRQNTRLSGNVTLADNYLYKGIGSLENPQVGDLRIEYLVLPTDSTVTVFGKLESPDRITPYFHKKNTKLYWVFRGTRDEAIATLKTNYDIAIWLFRFSGFLIMWIGLALASNPISVFLDFIPFLGSVSESVAGLTSFWVAFVLSTATILVSTLIHHPIALVIALTISLGVMIVLRRHKP